MLTKENIEKLKQEWYSSKDIEQLQYRLKKIDSWEAEFLSEEEFWSSVYFEINNSLKKKECIA